MIDSSSTNMICLASPNVVVCFGQDKDSKGVPIAFPNFNGWGDLSMRSFHSLAQDDNVGAAEKLRVELAARAVTGGQTHSHIFSENSDSGSVPAVTLLPLLNCEK